MTELSESTQRLLDQTLDIGARHRGDDSANFGGGEPDPAHAAAPRHNRCARRATGVPWVKTATW